MLDWLGRLRRSPVRERVEPAYRSEMLRLILLSMFVMTAVSFAVYTIVKPAYLPSILMHVGSLSACVFAWVIMRHGRLELAGYVFCGVLWLIVNLAALFFDGVDGAVFAVNLLVMLSAGLLLGERGVLTFAILTLCAGLAMFLLESSGGASGWAFAVLPLTAVLLTQIANLSFSGVLLYLYVRTINQASTQIRRQARSLQTESDERRLAEAQIQDSELRYRNLFDLAPEAIITLSLAGFVTSSNPAFGNLTGYAADEIVGRHFSRVPTLRVQDMPRYAHIFERLLRGDPEEPIEFRWWHRDGTAHWALAHIALMRQQGRAIEFMVALRDITERKLATELLSALNQAALAIEQAQTVPEIYAAASAELDALGFTCVIFLIDEQGKNLRLEHSSFGPRAVRAAERLVGLQSQGFTSEIDAVDMYRQVVRERKAVLVTDPSIGLAQHMPNIAAATAARALRILGIARAINVPLVDRDRVVGLLSVQGDALTERQVPAISAFASQMGAAIAKTVLMQDLQDSLDELGRTQAQLVQAQKMQAIGQLAGGVAHDFNNILTTVTGYSAFVMSQLPEDSPLRADVREIQVAAERAASLTQQLLAFSRKQVLRPQVIDLNAISSNLEQMLRRLIGENISLRFRLEPALGQVQADAGQIEQVIVNLVVNARDAMLDGGELVVETANVLLEEDLTHQHFVVPAGSYVTLAVSDTGTGMTQGVMQHIFEPFFTTKEPGQGTGLGLATVFGIIAQSGGHIMPASEIGKGTRFTIYLPRTAEPVESASSARDPAPAPGGTETILLVEDEDIVRRLACRALERSGYTVLEAATPEIALQISSQQDEHIDLLMTDVIMPGMGGEALAARVAADRPDVKVLYMSGYTDSEIVQRGVLRDQVCFCQKPFTPAELALKVREALQI